MDCIEKRRHVGRHAQNARKTIIDAAEDLVIGAGVRHLTLDAVAAKAGVSKGGLLYHFPNKQALLNAMLDRRVARVEQRRQEKLALLPEGQKSAIAAYVLSVLERDERANKLAVALLAAVVHDPHLLAPYQKEFKQRIDEFCGEGLSFERAAVIMLAATGLSFLELFSLFPFTGNERNRIVEKIITL
jgi:AcrR family transcriptional regulator